MTLLRRLSLCLVVVLGLAAPTSSPRAQVEHAVMAVPAVTILFLAYFIAEDEGIFTRQDIDLKTVNIAGIGAMNAVISGSADFSLSSGGSFTRAISHGQKLLIIVDLVQHLAQTVVLRKDIADQIHFDPTAPLAVRAQAMRGRSFGMGGVNSVSDAFLRLVAKAGGVRPDEIIEAPLQPSDEISALERHAIDGFTHGPPWAQQVVIEGKAVVIADGAKGEPSDATPYADGIVVTRASYCTDHRSICAKMGHAMLLGTEAIFERPRDALTVLKKRYPTVDDRVLQAALDSMTTLAARPPVMTIEALQNADRLNVEVGFMKPEDQLPSYDGLFDNQFVK